jgi:hypothetical protein
MKHTMMIKSGFILLVFVVLLMTDGIGVIHSIEVERTPFQPTATLGNEPVLTLDDVVNGLCMDPPDSGYISLVDSLVDYGGQASCPLNYPNARHLVHNHVHGVPVIVYEYGPSRNNDIVMVIWNDFGFWEPPISISNQEVDAGRCGIAGDSRGNIHAAWHQSDDGINYYVMYALYLWEEGQFVNYKKISDDGDAGFPSIAVDGEDNPWVAFTGGNLLEQSDIKIAHSNDYGETWEPLETVPDGPFSGGWLLVAIDVHEESRTPHIVFSGGDDPFGTWYSFRDPKTEEWAEPDMSAEDIYCATIVVNKTALVQLAGIQSSGWGSNFGNTGVLKYWYGTYGDWSEPESPFNESWEDSFAAFFPTLNIDECDNIVMAWAQIDTVIEQRAVSGLFGSYLMDGADRWHPKMHWTEPDEWDVIYPQLNHKSNYVNVSKIPGIGVVWGGMIDATQPSSVCYLYLGDILPEPCEKLVLVPTIDIDVIEIDGHVCLRWKGNASGYNLYRSQDEYGQYTRLNDATIVTRSYIDSDVLPGELYVYRINAVDCNGNENGGSGTAMIRLAGSPLAGRALLEPACPNPFNPVTHIRYRIPGKSHTILRVYDVTGKRIRLLVEEVKDAGEYTVVWKGKDDRGNHVASGTYFCRIDACGRSETRRLLLVR